MTTPLIKRAEQRDYQRLFMGPTPGSWTRGVITQQVAA